MFSWVFSFMEFPPDLFFTLSEEQTKTLRAARTVRCSESPAPKRLFRSRFDRPSGARWIFFGCWGWHP